MGRPLPRGIEPRGSKDLNLQRKEMPNEASCMPHSASLAFHATIKQLLLQSTSNTETSTHTHAHIAQPWCVRALSLIGKRCSTHSFSSVRAAICAAVKGRHMGALYCASALGSSPSVQPCSTAPIESKLTLRSDLAVMQHRSTKGRSSSYCILYFADCVDEAANRRRHATTSTCTICSMCRSALH